MLFMDSVLPASDRDRQTERQTDRQTESLLLFLLLLFVKATV